MSLSRYIEIKVIGRGSYGDVTLVKCRDDGKKVSGVGGCASFGRFATTAV